MHALRLEPYDPARHYADVASWWAARGDKCLPADVLPPTGAVAYDGEEVVAACSLWLTNAKAAHLAFPIVKPDLRPIIAFRAVELVVAECIAIAQRHDVTMIWGTAEHQGVDRIFTRAGLSRVTPQLNSYFLFLKPEVSHDILVGEEFEQQKGTS